MTDVPDYNITMKTTLRFVSEEEGGKRSHWMISERYRETGKG